MVQRPQNRPKVREVTRFRLLGYVGRPKGCSPGGNDIFSWLPCQDANVLANMGPHREYASRTKPIGL